MELANLSARQYGIVDLADLVRLGVPRFTAALWARTGRLHRLHVGVYSVVPPALLPLEGRWLAAVRACGPDALLSHGSAAELRWMADRTSRGPLHVTVPDRSRRRRPGIVVHRPVALASCDATVHAGIPVTAPARTVWDLAATEPPRITRRAFERAQGYGLIDRARLEKLLKTNPSHRGSGLIRALLTERHLPLSEVRSWLEQLALHLCSEHGLPLPAVNVPLLGYEVDLLWERQRLVLEADGGDHLTPRQRDLDNRRDAVLGRAGYLVRRYSSTAMARETAVAAELHSIIVERTPSGT
jgi:hypothetical protein